MFYEMCVSLRIPLVQGGIQDQPYIWLEQWALIQHKESFWKTIINMNAVAPASSFAPPATSTPPRMPGV
jgi:hypothetical protein